MGLATATAPAGSGAVVVQLACGSKRIDRTVLLSNDTPVMVMLAVVSRAVIVRGEKAVDDAAWSCETSASNMEETERTSKKKNTNQQAQSSCQP